jgi:hypothetical protein
MKIGYNPLHLLMCFCFLSDDIVDRAHQGFGWVGEWANTRLVKLESFLGDCVYSYNVEKNNKWS